MSNLQGIDKKNLSELAKAQAYIKDEVRSLINIEKQRDEEEKKSDKDLLKFEYAVNFEQTKHMRQKRSDLLPQPIKVNAHSF